MQGHRKRMCQGRDSKQDPQIESPFFSMLPPKHRARAKEEKMTWTQRGRRGYQEVMRTARWDEGLSCSMGAGERRS
jgi:hypothetical protein